MSLFRSLGDSVEDRLNKLLIPLENNLLTKDMVYKATKFTLCEMVATGTTCYGDMYFFCNDMARATEEIGVRGVIGQTITYNESPDAKTSRNGFEKFEEFYKNYKESKLITPSIAPHAPYSNNEESLLKAEEISKKYDIPLMIHLSEMAFENGKYEKYGSSIKYLDSLDMLSKRLIGAHGVYALDSDIELLSQREVNIINCPISNAKSARSIAKIHEMLEKGVNVAIGTDGPMSGNHMDMSNLMSIVPIIQKMATGNRFSLPTEKILEMATINGAKALGLDNKTGSIKVGKLADLVLINPNTFNMLPIYDYYSAIVYSMQKNNIEKVIVNGELIYNKEILKGDTDKIIEEFLNEVEKIEVKSRELLSQAMKK